MKNKFYIASIDRKVLGSLVALLIIICSVILSADSEKAVQHCINNGYEEIHGKGYCSDTLKE